MSNLNHLQWRDEHAETPYPFADGALLVNDDGRRIEQGMFVDASIYPRGATAGLYLEQVIVANTTLTFVFSLPSESAICSAIFRNTNTTGELEVIDVRGQHCGVLLVNPLLLLGLFAWGEGTHFFTEEQTELAASCQIPLPEQGVTGLLLDDGSIVSNDVYLVAEDGLQFGVTESLDVGSCGRQDQPITVVTTHAVGDPLFRRKQCEPNLFDAPRFIREIVFQRGPQTIRVRPDSRGNIMIAQASVASDSTVLRLSNDAQGLIVEAVGEPLKGIT